MTATSARLRELLAESGHDWLALSGPENIFYATGYRSVGADLMAAHSMLALVSVDRTVVAAPAGDAAAAFEAGLDPEHYVPFGTFYFEPGESDGPEARVADVNASAEDAFAKAARLAGIAGRVGTDARAADLAGSALAAVGGDVEITDATPWLYDVRAIKLEPEIDRLRTAARLAEEGIDAAVAAARTGVTEAELAQVVAATMAAGGGMPRFVVVTSGERSALSDARAGRRALRAGDLLRFDVGCTYGGYWSDVGRTAVVGEPSSLVAHRYAAILAGEEAQLAAAGPGITAEGLFDAAMTAVAGAGLEPYRRHHCGHAIGLEVYERPIIAPGWDTPLGAGMVFCVETPYYEIGWGGMMVEDTLVVREERAELLTGSERALRVIEA